MKNKKMFIIFAIIVCIGVTGALCLWFECLTKDTQLAELETSYVNLKFPRQYINDLKHIEIKEDNVTTEIFSMVVKENEIGEIVVGLPKNMDGTEGPRAELCREFAGKLEAATNLPVRLWDERRTTVEAHNILSQHNYHGQKRKNTVDAVAASLILEGYLAFRRSNR